MYEDYIEQALANIGAVYSRDPDEFVSQHKEEFKDINWRPRYLFQANAILWGFSIFSGEKVPNKQLLIMSDAQTRLKNFRAGFFVPEDRDADIIASACSKERIALIAKVGSAYQVLNTEIGFPTGKVIDRPLRIPPPLVQRIKELHNIEPSIKGVLVDFASEHSSLSLRGGNQHINEEALVKSTFSKLLGLQPLLTPTAKPLDITRTMEKLCQHSGFHDHYFHTLQNFLLGCIVIDNCRGQFLDFLKSFFGIHYDLLPEHIWILTALFHDVGYCIERKDEFDGEITGVRGDMDFSTGVASGMSEALEATISHMYSLDPEAHARNQLVHLFNYLTMPVPQGSWQRNPRYTDEHPFRNALEDNFFSARHGVHSAFRLLRAVFPWPHSLTTQIEGQEREPAIACAYLAAISIPFHDRAFRTALRNVDISSVGTCRFPFAALLAFIDSIQDDRREPSVPDPSNDILEGLEVDNMKVSASLDLSRLTDRQILKKRMEAVDIIDFFEPDGLCYEFPKDLIG